MSVAVSRGVGSLRRSVIPWPAATSASSALRGRCRAAVSSPHQAAPERRAKSTAMVVAGLHAHRGRVEPDEQEPPGLRREVGQVSRPGAVEDQRGAVARALSGKGRGGGRQHARRFAGRGRASARCRSAYPDSRGGRRPGVRVPRRISVPVGEQPLGGSELGRRQGAAAGGGCPECLQDGRLDGGLRPVRHPARGRSRRPGPGGSSCAPSADRRPRPVRCRRGQARRGRHPRGASRARAARAR